MVMPGRSFSAASQYRYGFNGKENDKDISEGGQDYGMRIYDARIGKFLSVDPIGSQFPYYTPYQYAGNKPIWCVDIDGLEDLPATELNKYGEKQVYETTSTTEYGSAGPMSIDVVKNIPKYAQPVTKGMTDMQVYQLAFNRYASPGKFLIKSNQYIDERLMKAEQQTSFFFTHNVPAYSKSTYATNVAQTRVAVGLMKGNPQAVEQIQKTDNFLYRHSWAPIVAGFMADVYMILEISLTKTISVTIGRKYEGVAANTAEKVGAPYYTEWEQAGIYNIKDFEGWGEAFKYVTNKVISSKGKIHFELAGIDIRKALAGNPTEFVGRYTEYELQQVILDLNLFKNTEFYLNGVKQTANDLKNLGVIGTK